MILLQNIPVFFPLLNNGSFELGSFQSPGSESDATIGCVFTTEELALSPLEVEKWQRSWESPFSCRDRDKSG